MVAHAKPIGPSRRGKAEGKLEFYCGALGSGKTSFAFDEALAHLLKGGTVVTNIEFYPEVIREWMERFHGLEFDPARLIKIEDATDIWKLAVRGTDRLETLLLIDEAHVEHGARAWDKTTKEETMFNTMVRKLRIRLIYITQDINNVDKQFRRMAQTITYCRNLGHVRFLGIFRAPFNMFFRVPYMCGPGVPPKLQSPEVCFRPQSWGMFNSHSLVGRAAETFGGLAEASDVPLKRIQRPFDYTKLYRYGAIAAGLGTILT